MLISTEETESITWLGGSICLHGQFSVSSDETVESVDFLYTLDSQLITDLSWLLISEVSGHDQLVSLQNSSS